MAEKSSWLNTWFTHTVSFLPSIGRRRSNSLGDDRTLKITWADQDVITSYQTGIPGGRVKFVGEGFESKDTKTEANYLVVNDDSPEYMDTIAIDMAGKWKMRTPKLVLSVISSFEHYRTWNRQQDEEDFQDGLMMAASLTDMWIVTEGPNCGINALIGKAIATERGRRKILHAEQTLGRFLSTERLPRLTVIGVVGEIDLSKELVSNLTQEYISNERQPTPIATTGKEEEEFVHLLTPNMTHFFIVNESTSIDSFLHRLEMRLMRPVGKARRYFNTADSEAEAGQTPLVGLLIQGGPRDINHVLTLLSKNVPVIVVCGQGMVADILAFAFRSGQNVGDMDVKDSYIKTELLRRLTEVFPNEFKEDMLSRNQCRDRILECVKYATQGDSVLLTLLDNQAQISELRDLSKVILTSVLTSRSQGVTESLTEQIQWNLQLTIDWKKPDLAVSEIYNKYGEKIQIGDEQFQQVLLGPGRQEFVEVFLDRGFVLHKYLNSRRLELLFKMCEDREFFAEICLETILGEKMTLERPLPDDFLSGKDCLLNHLLHLLTGLNNLIDPLQLSLNASNDRVQTAAVAEQRALHALIYWAALTYDTKLMKILWGRTSEPMAMALVLSTLHSRLAKNWISDPDLQLKTKKIGIEFGQLAVKMIDLNYRESKSQALDTLTTKLMYFKKYSAVDLAIIGKNKFFIAHPCCQKYAYNLWYGSIRIQKRKIWFIEIPEMFKNASVGANMKREVLLIVKLYYIWIAPVTQFWISQMFFIAFLALFAYALSQPYCGDPFVHKLLTLWLIVLFVDNLYSLLAKKMHCREFPTALNWHIMIVIVYTISIVVPFRILHDTTISYTTVKFMLSLSLIYLFYYAMGHFYPVSQTLGPMFVNITVMMRRDLLNWLKMFSLSLISGSVAIHAVLYPAETFNLHVVFKTLLRGIFALFLTDVQDLQGGPCSCLYNYTSQFGCNDNEIPEIVKDRISTCPRTSAGGYVIVLAYIYQTKLVYNTLIFAICSVTMARTYGKVLEIWKFQFFMLVQDFVIRPALPVPLVMLVYPALLIKSVFIAIYHFFLTCCSCWKRPKKAPYETYNMWNAFIKLHKKEEKMAIDKFNENKTTELRLTFIANEQKNKDRQISNLNDRLVEVLNSQTSMFLMIEHMQNVLEASTRKKAEKSTAVSLEIIQHIHARKSPYPSTGFRRYAVFDKYLQWEETYPNYDPPLFSRALEEYEEDVRKYMDQDMVEVIAKREVHDVDREDTESMEYFELNFNAVKEDKTIYGEIFTLDRISWMTKDDQIIQYSIDANEAPRNPMGRTGLRGRGNLWRYGPNHMMFAVISRWKSSYNSDGVAQGNLLVGGKRVKEILVVQNPLSREDVLPGGFVSGRTSSYSVMCEVFMRDILGEKDVPGSLSLDQDDMILFFRQFVSSDFILSGILGMNISASTGFSSKLLFRGYMDDPNNTDNAWVEAEVWSFHYHSKDKFDKKVPQRERYWREISRWMQLTGYHIPFVMGVDDLYTDS